MLHITEVSFNILTGRKKEDGSCFTSNPSSSFLSGGKSLV